MKIAFTDVRNIVMSGKFIDFQIRYALFVKLYEKNSSAINYCEIYPLSGFVYEGIFMLDHDGQATRLLFSQ